MWSAGSIAFSCLWHGSWHQKLLSLGTDFIMSEFSSVQMLLRRARGLGSNMSHFNTVTVPPQMGEGLPQFYQKSEPQPPSSVGQEPTLELIFASFLKSFFDFFGGGGGGVYRSLWETHLTDLDCLPRRIHMNKMLHRFQGVHRSHLPLDSSKNSSLSWNCLAFIFTFETSTGRGEGKKGTYLQTRLPHLAQCGHHHT